MMILGCVVIFFYFFFFLNVETVRLLQVRCEYQSVALTGKVKCERRPCR